MKVKIPFFALTMLSSLLLMTGHSIAAATSKPPLAFLTPDAVPATAAAKLGWVSKPNCPNLCGGYYIDPPLPAALLAPDFITINFKSSELRSDGRSLLKGNVTVNQAPDRQLLSDKAYIYRNNAGEFTRLELYGNVRLQEAGKYIVGNKARVKLTTRQGDYYDALYRITLDPASYSPVLAASSDQTGSSLTAYGHADKISQLAEGKLALDKATYTSCSPTTNSWRLKAKKIDLDHDTGRGIAHNAVLTVKDIPVFYTPYFNFPIDQRRQSGFLFPTLGSSNNGGFSFGIPYYWNLAPNYDMTITPTYFGKRGLQISNLFRYLTPSSNGNIHYSVLPNDSAFRSFQRAASAQHKTNPALKDLMTATTARQYFAWQHVTNFNPYWSGTIDYTRVNDDYYFQDFSNTPTLTTTNQLLQQAKVNYNDGHWAFQGMVQQYQTLHPVTLAPVNNQYARLPQLLFSGSIPDEKTGLVYQFNSEFAHFWRPMNPGEIIRPVAGDRINIQPGVSLPIIGPAGYITPSVQFNMTQYAVFNQAYNYPNNVFRTMPFVSIDSGLYFERNLKLFSKDYRQILEPRLFYLYVPYRQQHELPVFDSGLQVFNYDQLFRVNRFTGLDRIGDTHQVTLALTTSMLDQETGVEKFRASVGQIYYFRDRKVMLCNNTKDCVDPITTVGATSNTDHSSPLAGQFSYYLNQYWNSNANITWDPHSRKTQNGSFNFQYTPKANYILNMGYNFIRYGDVLLPDNPNNSKNNLNQASISFAMPIRQHWRTVGGWTHNLSHEHAQSFFYGAEYNTCCWATRMVIAHTVTGLNSSNAPIFNKVIYLQLLLKGMSNIGTNDPTLIMNTISGYRDNFGSS